MKKIITIALACLLSFSLVGCDLFGGEATTTEAPVITTVDYDHIIDVATAQELQDMELNKSYRLVADIDLQDFDWTPLGDYETPFLGNFDGNGYTISNLSLTANDYIYAGLFGKLYGDVTNVTLLDFSIQYETDFLTYVGTLAGYTEGDVKNVTVQSSSINVENTESNTYAGLLVGYTQPRVGEYTTVDLFDANELVDNLVQGTLIVDTKSIGYIGGLVGKSFDSYIAQNEVNTEMRVTFNDYLGYVGGLVGHLQGGILYGYEEEVTDVNIYLEDNIVKSSMNIYINKEQLSVGGLAGYIHESYVRNNYSDTTILVDGLTDEETEVNLGTFVGENWDSTLENNVSVYAIANTLAGDFTYRHNYLTGQNLTEKPWVNNFTVVSFGRSADPTDSTVTGLTILENQTVLDEAFFTTNLNWSAGFINKILSLN